jgi:hypothetical protein
MYMRLPPYGICGTVDVLIVSLHVLTAGVEQRVESDQPDKKFA